MRWLQKQNDDEDKSRMAAGREFQSAGPQLCTSDWIKLKQSDDKKVKTGADLLIRITASDSQYILKELVTCR